MQHCPRTDSGLHVLQPGIGHPTHQKNRKAKCPGWESAGLRMSPKQSSLLPWNLEELVGKEELFALFLRNRRVAGGGKRGKKGATTSKQAAGALCIQM
ncbi:Hypothetical predicted protein [Marmota monax]|uniref:Uncharacterized protein n=1 Tax=Marmota monax TaxID=9995 RepID=A0A5E4BRM4_MARMO|nr:Hypothetical predicted protein [Marmota monax]